MRRTFTATLVVLLLSCQATYGWGFLGHRLTARIAEQHLTPEARAAVKDLLDEGEDMAEASLWADKVKRSIKGSAPWHYVDVPLDEPRYDAKYCPAEGCVVSKIAEFRAVLKDKTRPRAERQQALRFLIHLVGDLHMPMHVGDNNDAGGNKTQIRFNNRGANMHSLWDTLLIESVTKDEETWLKTLAELDTEANRAAWQAGTVEDWATESLLAARAAYVVPGTDDKRIKSGQKLGSDYAERSMPMVRQRLAQAGVRMAWVVNEALGE